MTLSGRSWLVLALVAPAIFACICVVPPAEGPPGGALPPSGPPSAPPSAPDPEPPSDDDGTACVADLNARCAERWCKGGVNYRFEDLTCAGDGCTLRYRSKSGGKKDQGTCELRADGPDDVCSDRGFDLVTACLER